MVYPEMQQRMMDRAKNKHRRVNAMRLMEENTSAFGNLLSFDGAHLMGNGAGGGCNHLGCILLH